MTAFVDTHVLVYARDASEPEKQPVAREWIDRLWRTRQGRLSVQVLNEYYVTVTRKLHPGMSMGDARADVRDLMSWNPTPVDAALLSRAWAVERRFGLQYWDALIVASAQWSGCRHLLTEDLQDGQELDGVLVMNPFTHQPERSLPA
ncbi:MAG: PIN domain-containing protein [bacterium]|nr:PIN domain-containing protein [bacterium]MDE0502140.1 PIN domain-containing protein [bacterium]